MAHRELSRPEGVGEGGPSLLPNRRSGLATGTQPPSGATPPPCIPFVRPARTLSHLLFVGDADSVARFFFPLEAVPVFYLKLPGDCYESGSPKVEGSITGTTSCSPRKYSPADTNLAAPEAPPSNLRSCRRIEAVS